MLLFPTIIISADIIIKVLTKHILPRQFANYATVYDNWLVR